MNRYPDFFFHESQPRLADGKRGAGEPLSNAVTTDPAIPNELINGRYRALQPIGTGGLGHVFYGVDEQLGRPVAIKRLHREGEVQEKYRDAWIEARALASLQHPNIVTLFDFGEDKEGAFFIMEYIAGETLEDVVAMGLMSETDFRVIARQCLAGIGAAHGLGIVHRDIKPTNIMVQAGSGGEISVKILDFGLAKFQKTPEPQTTDHENNLLGSIYFMAPEQFSRKPIDGRADLYALGNVFYHLLSGRMAHEADTVQQVLYSHLEKTPASLTGLRPDLSPALCLWVHQLMQRDPLERPQSTQEALQLLEPEAAGVHAGIKTRLKPPTAGTPRASVPWWVGAAVGVFILAAFCVFLFFKAKAVPEPEPAPKPKAEEALAVITDSLPTRDPVLSTPAVKIVDPLDLEKLKMLPGQEIQAEGVPVKVGENKDGSILYLNFSSNYRTALSLVFFVKDHPETFTRPALEKFLNEKIRVRGILGEYNGAPQIKMDSLEQIIIQPE